MTELKPLELKAAKTRAVTAKDFIKMVNEERDNIQSVKILPGRLGGKHFGRLVVTTKRPIYVPFDSAK